MQVKRILSMLLAAALIFTTSMVTVNAESIETVESIETFEVGVVAETTAPISLSPAIYKSGDEVSVKISAAKNTGITILKFSIKFDPNALEFVDYTSTNLFSNDIEGVYPYSDSICYTLMMNNASTATGEMLTLKFKVKDTYCGNIDVYAEVFDGQDKNCINGLNVVPFVGGRASFAAHAVDAGAGIVTKPTCTEQGYTTYSCENCNESVIGNYVAANGHTKAEAVEENRLEADCTNNGSYDMVVYCEVCDAELSRDSFVVNAHGHTEAEAVEENRVEADCTNNGSYDMVVYCEDCNAELSRENFVINAHGHTEAEAVEENRVEADCINNGSYDMVVYCEICDAELSRESFVINAHGHDLTALDSKAPTCTEVGWEAYNTCSKCDYTTYVELPALGHEIIHHDSKAPTCTEIGWEAYDDCSRCDYTTYVEIEALGHTYGESTIVEPEYKVEGYTTHTCTACNHEEKYNITPALTYILGDTNGNEVVDSEDAINLLYYTLLPESISVNQECDFDGDGDVDSDDAIYLLYHTLLPDEYPLHK